MMPIYGSFRAVVGWFSANSDGRVTEIGTTANFDIVILISYFQIDIVTQYTFSLYTTT